MGRYFTDLSGCPRRELLILFQGRGPPGRGKKMTLTEKGSISRCVCEGGACFRGGRGFIFVVRAGVHDWVSRRPDDVLGITDARVETVYGCWCFCGTVPATFAERGDWVGCFDPHVLARIMSVKRDTRSAYPPCAL